MFLHSAFCLLHFAFAAMLLAIAPAPAAKASELTVDRKTIRLDELVNISVTLEGDSATIDNVSLPLQNLVVAGPPSSSSEFSWFNGSVTRRKTLQYQARAKAAGTAVIGPLVLIAGGARETLPAITIQVLPDLTSTTNDPTRILHELLATNRDPVFMTVEADRTHAFVGEEIVVNWTVYAAVNVTQWQLDDLPHLDDFWAEELDTRRERPKQVILGDTLVQSAVVRRVALFPLRSGTLSVGSMSVDAAVMRRLDSPFGLFEGTQVQISRRAAPISFDIRPIPTGPAPDVVGDVDLHCSAPIQRGGGPVVVEATMSGQANLRAATPPRWDRAVEGSAQMEQGSLSIDRQQSVASMKRSWRFLLFPEHAGRFTVPPLEATALTSSGERKTLRCEASTLDVAAAAASTTSTSSSPPPTPPLVRAKLTQLAPWILGALLAIVFVLFAAPRIRRALMLRARARALVRLHTPAAIRDEVYALLLARDLDAATLLDEQSESGEAYRAVRSLLDAVERDRVLLVDVEGDLEQRLRELLAFLL